MNELLKSTINDIYFDKNYDLFRGKCKKTLQLFEDIFEYAVENNILVIKEKTDNRPSNRIYFDLKYFAKGEFKVRFKTLLQVSKIIPVFYIQHEFEVDNLVDDRMDSTLDGFCSYQAYTKAQAELEEKIVSNLYGNNYIKLSYAEMNEVVPELKYSKGVTIFGSQVTVEQLIFNDVFGICDNDG